MKSITYVIAFFLIAGTARAQEFLSEPEVPAESTAAADDDKPQTVAIQSRPYILNKELGVYYAFMPLDHFNHFHAFGATYLNYFNDYLAWEVFNAATVTKQSTGLKERLLDDYGAVPDTFDVLQYYFTTSVVYTPIYMKHLYNNEFIRFGDFSLVAGAGVARFENALNSNMVEAGFISRFIGSEGLNFKLDVRYKMFLNGDLRPNLAIGLVFTYNFTDEVKGTKVLDEE